MKRFTKFCICFLFTTTLVLHKMTRRMNTSKLIISVNDYSAVGDLRECPHSEWFSDQQLETMGACRCGNITVHNSTASKFFKPPHKKWLTKNGRRRKHGCELTFHDGNYIDDEFYCVCRDDILRAQKTALS